MSRSTHGCERCRAQNADVLQQIGPGVRNEYVGGKAKEMVTEFECTECGAKWRKIVEWGLGGPGRSWSPRMTE